LAALAERATFFSSYAVIGAPPPIGSGAHCGNRFGGRQAQREGSLTAVPYNLRPLALYDPCY